MQDGIGRRIEYLRISVTDRCNLRCRYCMPPQGIEQIPHKELLTLEEIARLVHIMTGLGISKVRLTGGEPLVRRNLRKLVEDIHSLPELRDIAMTTNGVLFAPLAKEYAASGLSAVNISLDTLDAAKYDRITGMSRAGGRSNLDRVLEAIDTSVRLGLKVRLNCVPSREFNEEDVVSLAALAKDKPIDVRYIELMPIGCGREYTGISQEELLGRIEAAYGAAAAEPPLTGLAAGPAQYYRLEGFCGRIGFISPMSHKFCSGCNRVRLTCEGRLKLCLHYDSGIELKPLLRGGASDEDIRAAIESALQVKPAEHHFYDADGMQQHEDARKMVQIGG